MCVKLKICGLTSLSDAVAAAEAGASFLGFVMYGQSPRYVAPAKVREIVAKLPATVSTVGVFVNETPRIVDETMEFCGLDIVQLHGDEPEADIRRLGSERVWKAVHLESAADVDAGCASSAAMLVADSRVGNCRGGTGIVGDWALASRLAVRRRLMLAGGLSPGNFAEAVACVSPYGADVCSGVESRPGRKDHRRLAELGNLLAAMSDGRGGGGVGASGEVAGDDNLDMDKSHGTTGSACEL